MIGADFELHDIGVYRILEFRYRGRFMTAAKLVVRVGMRGIQFHRLEEIETSVPFAAHYLVHLTWSHERHAQMVLDIRVARR